MFSRSYFNDSSILLKYPELVSQNKMLSMSSAFWYYMTPEGSNPSMHDV